MRPLVVLTHSSAPEKSILSNIKSFGYDCIHIPALSIIYHDTSFIIDRTPQTLIITSKHALHKIGTYNLPSTIPILCVGQSVADRAINIGFENIDVIFETVHDLIQHLKDYTSKYSNLFFLRGKHIQHDIKNVCQDIGLHLQEHIAYTAIFSDNFSKDVHQKLHDYHSVILCVFSQRGAQSLSKIIETTMTHDIIKRTSILCLSNKMVQYIDHIKWQNIYVASNPTQTDFLKKLEDIKG